MKRWRTWVPLPTVGCAHANPPTILAFRTLHECVDEPFITGEHMPLPSANRRGCRAWAFGRPAGVGWVGAGLLHRLKGARHFGGVPGWVSFLEVESAPIPGGLRSFL